MTIQCLLCDSAFQGVTKALNDRLRNVTRQCLLGIVGFQSVTKDRREGSKIFLPGQDGFQSVTCDKAGFAQCLQGP